jgi:hypothetical protein
MNIAQRGRSEQISGLTLIAFLSGDILEALRCLILTNQDYLPAIRYYHL